MSDRYTLNPISLNIISNFSLRTKVYFEKRNNYIYFCLFSYEEQIVSFGTSLQLFGFWLDKILEDVADCLLRETYSVTTETLNITLDKFINPAVLK